MSLSHPSQFVEFGEHDHDGGIVFPQHAPEVVGGDLQRSLGCDVSPPLPVPVYEVGVYVVRPFQAPRRSTAQTHTGVLIRQQVYQTVFRLVHG